MDHLDIHFLNVGHGDCTFIDLPSGNLMMIDINNTRSLPEEDRTALASHHNVSIEGFLRRGFLGTPSREERYVARLTDPIDYYRSHFNGQAIHRYVQTHPDMDHMTGLWDFFWIEKIPLTNFWDTRHKKSFVEAEFAGSRFEWNDWLTYRQLAAGKLPDGNTTKVGYRLAGDEGAWSEEGITVLSPMNGLLATCNATNDWNNASYVLRIDYGERSVILPGDAEEPAWDAIESSQGRAALKCDILKAPHHGRRSGYSPSALKATAPSVVICSVGKRPATDASAKYEQAGASVLSTRYHGSMRLRIWESGRATIINDRRDVIKTLPRNKSWLETLWL
jgi:beta-lactamase superfamily II metal-dependent hydrolase